MTNEPDIVFKHLPSVEEIRALESDDGRHYFRIPDEDFSPDYLIDLRNEFPDKHMTYLPWSHCIFIAPAIQTSVVLDNIALFYSCFEAFEKLARELMAKIGEEYQIDINNHPEIHHLKSRVLERQRGKLSGNWKLRFHGFGCMFTNSVTNQMLDVFVQAPPHFGALDNYYVMQFINTTKGMEQAAKLLEDKTASIAKVIDIMHDKGYLIPIDQKIWTDKLTLNHNKKPENYQ